VCGPCGIDPDSQIPRLRANGTGQNVGDLLHHCNYNEHHARRMVAGRGQLCLDAGWPLYWDNPPIYDMVFRCRVCALSPAGDPRHKYSSIQPANIAQHLGGPDHARRLADGRTAVYAAAHQGHPGRFPGEVW
jgi:hypothetical protein